MFTPTSMHCVATTNTGLDLLCAEVLSYLPVVPDSVSVVRPSPANQENGIACLLSFANSECIRRAVVTRFTTTLLPWHRAVTHSALLSLLLSVDESTIGLWIHQYHSPVFLLPSFFRTG